jgi:hypothetical protein
MYVSGSEVSGGPLELRALLLGEELPIPPAAPVSPVVT